MDTGLIIAMLLGGLIVLAFLLMAYAYFGWDGVIKIILIVTLMILIFEA